MSLYSFPRIFLSLHGGMLTDRYGAKTAGMASLLGVSIGTALVAAGQSYWVMALGRLVAGIGATLLLIVTPQAITSWFHDREIALSMGIFNMAMPFGTILSLNFAGILAFHYGWRAPISVTLAICVATLILFLKFYRERDFDSHAKKKSIGLITLIKQTGWDIWAVGSVWGLFNAACISYFTYAPDYFIAQGKNVAWAGLLASFPMWGAMLLAPVFGVMMDKIGRKRQFLTLGLGLSAILFYIMPRFPNHAALLAITVGIVAAVIPLAVYALPAELLPGSLMGLAFGIISTTLGIGQVIGPYVAGVLRDITGNYLWSFHAMAIFSALGILPVLLMSKNKETNID
jgi:MFS family permease